MATAGQLPPTTTSTTTTTDDDDDDDDWASNDWSGLADLLVISPVHGNARLFASPTDDKGTKTC